MRAHSFTRYLALPAFVGALACARNPEPDDETAAARDTVSDTLGGEAQNPPGYRGMERDTTIAPETEQTDTFLQNQGQGRAQDTAGYGGLERPDTTGYGQDTTGAGVQDTTGTGVQDTTGAWGTDTTGAGARDTSGAWGRDTSGAWGTDTSRMGTDTTGYNPSQQSRDTTGR
jgi:hypothetical protein